MWKQSLIALVVACSLTACKGGGLEEAASFIKSLTSLTKFISSDDEENESKLPNKPIGLKLPAPQGLQIVPPKYAPDVVNASAQTYRSPIQYKPHTAPAIYFDKTGKMVTQMPTNGYSRQFLGKMPDGREVAQDFYASGSPQTAPFILRKGADRQSFDSSMIDGLLLNFARDGSLHAVSEYRDGQLFGVQSVYKNKKLIAQIAGDEQNTTMWLLYPNGVVKAQIAGQVNQNGEITFFREDGSAHAKILREGDALKVAIWQPNGQIVAEGEEFDNIFQQLLTLMQEIQKEVNEIENS